MNLQIYIMFNEVSYILSILERKVWRRCFHIYCTEEKLFFPLKDCPDLCYGACNLITLLVFAFIA